MSMNVLNRHRNIHFNIWRRQAGFTLIEGMISIALSLVVTSAMVALMANSLGTTTRVIQMSQLTDELRNTMSLLTRDIRRANYSANAAFCYANADCGTEALTEQFAEIDVSDGTCVSFGLDRDFDGKSSTDNAGGFRSWPVVIDDETRGVILMWVDDSAVDCVQPPDWGEVGDPWVAVTDPDFVDITRFFVCKEPTEDEECEANSFEQSITDEDETITQHTREIEVQLEGRLVRDNTITRRIEDIIKVRNDLITSI